MRVDVHFLIFSIRKIIFKGCCPIFLQDLAIEVQSATGASDYPSGEEPVAFARMRELHVGKSGN